MSRASREHAKLYGPCYDYCACRCCWRGWSGIPFRTRLSWRIDYIMHRRDKPMIIGRCSLGHVGLIRGRKEITYPDGTSALAYVGWHLRPLRLFGRLWSSRNPKRIL